MFPTNTVGKYRRPSGMTEEYPQKLEQIMDKKENFAKNHKNFEFNEQIEIIYFLASEAL